MPAPKMSGNDMLLAMKRGKLGPANDAPVGGEPPVDPDATQDAMPPAEGPGDPMTDLSQKVDSLTDMVQQIADKVGVAAPGAKPDSPIPPMEQAAEMSQ